MRFSLSTVELAVHAEVQTKQILSLLTTSTTIRGKFLLWLLARPCVVERRTAVEFNSVFMVVKFGPVQRVLKTLLFLLISLAFDIPHFD